MHLTQHIQQQLESRILECLNEHADLASIEEGTDGLWRAVAFYDGVDDKGYRAHVTFKYRLVGDDMVEEFQLLEFEGGGLVNPNIKLG